MNRRWVGLLVLLLGGLAHADPAAWRVSGGKGGELMLLGSVHYLRAQDHPLPPLIDELYARADALVMELDMDDIDPAQLQTELLGAAMLPPGGSLAGVLGKDVYSDASTLAHRFGVDLAMLDQFEPWLVALTLTDLGMSRQGFRPEHGLEQYLLRRSRSDGKEVFGLESIATQVGVFEGLSPAEQSALLAQTIVELETTNDTMQQLVAAWRDGSLDALADGLMQDFADFPDLYDALIVARNHRWAELLESYLASPQRHLVVVGALHLVGEGNVVELLEARGHSVTPLR